VLVRKEAMFSCKDKKKYTDYRAEKDPARGMLTRFHGSEWTEAYIHSVLFDLESTHF
jgi:phycoerythrobilin:ferredoxin oxidoreductase